MGKWLAGARRDARYPVRRSQSWSPKVSVQRDLGDKLALQISLGTAQRFPTVGELFQGRFDDVTQEIDPQSFDPNLKAEKSRDANIILRYRQGRSRLTASLFYQDIRDAIFSFSGLNSFGTVTTSYKNVDRVAATHFGAIRGKLEDKKVVNFCPHCFLYFCCLFSRFGLRLMNGQVMPVMQF